MKTFDEAFTELANSSPEKIRQDFLDSRSYMSNEQFVTYIHQKTCEFFHDIDESKSFRNEQKIAALLLHMDNEINALLAAQFHLIFQAGVLTGMKMESSTFEMEGSEGARE